jgi:hypothetical protein
MTIIAAVTISAMADSEIGNPVEIARQTAASNYAQTVNGLSEILAYSMNAPAATSPSQGGD